MKSLSSYIFENINNLILEKKRSNEPLFIDLSGNVIYNNEDATKSPNTWNSKGKSTWFDSGENMVNEFLNKKIYGILIKRLIGVKTFSLQILKNQNTDQQDINNKTIKQYIQYLRKFFYTNNFNKDYYIDTNESGENIKIDKDEIKINTLDIINWFCYLFKDKLTINKTTNEFLTKKSIISETDFKLNEESKEYSIIISDENYKINIENINILCDAFNYIFNCIKKYIQITNHIIDLSYFHICGNIENITFDKVPFVIKSPKAGNINIYYRFNIENINVLKSKIKKYISDKKTKGDKGIISYIKDKNTGETIEGIYSHIDKILSLKELHYGFGKSKGNKFEDQLYVKLCDYIIVYSNNQPEYENLKTKKYKSDVERTAINIIETLVKEGSVGYKIFNNLITKIKNDNINISDYVKQTGSRNSKRNSNGKIVSNEFDIDIEKDKVEKNIQMSGYEISDITITDEPSPSSEYNEHNEQHDIYLSVKYDDAQFSGININPPFYGSGTYNKSNNDGFAENVKLAIKHKKDKKTIYNDYRRSNKAFDNLCKLFGIDSEEKLEIICNYFIKNRPDNSRGKQGIQSDDDRESSIKIYENKPLKDNEKIQLSSEEEQVITNRKELLRSLVWQIIGGNYYYVNGKDAVCKYLPFNFENEKSLPFDIDLSHCTCYATPASLRLEFNIESEINKQKYGCQLVFRTSEKQADYPYRLFINIGESISDNNTKKFGANNSKVIELLLGINKNKKL